MSSARARSSQRPMSDNAILAAMRRMGIGQGRNERPRISRHGTDHPDEVLSFRPDFIEHQLAMRFAIRTVAPTTGPRIWRSAGKMMQAWADYWTSSRTART